ncbi:hypothetical protein O3P69_004438 [Scylla paramamosain]|uniref:EF-hand domain-containing protein n=1 Tax=Scylla paramamosain TaxID=85552 RepID=A0AAW0UC10_SCYPA
MYRGFKQECPTGVISEETFKEIYGKFFPLGGQPEDGTGRNSAMYAHYVFGTMDHDGSGTITFGDFIMGLSVLLKGTLQERINWIFNLYDINNDGYITKEELVDIVTSIYDLMGEQTSPAIDDGTPVDHVERIFEVSGRSIVSLHTNEEPAFTRGIIGQNMLMSENHLSYNQNLLDYQILHFILRL